jgi:hypothetical protein
MEIQSENGNERLPATVSESLSEGRLTPETGFRLEPV